MPGRTQMIWHMRIACWKTEAIVCNTYCFSTSIVTRTRPYVAFIRAMPVLLTTLSLRSKQDFNTKQNPTFLSHFIWDDLKLFNIFNNGNPLTQ